MITRFPRRTVRFARDAINMYIADRCCRTVDYDFSSVSKAGDEEDNDRPGHGRRFFFGFDGRDGDVRCALSFNSNYTRLS